MISPEIECTEKTDHILETPELGELFIIVLKVKREIKAGADFIYKNRDDIQVFSFRVTHKILDLRDDHTKFIPTFSLIYYSLQL